MARAVKPMSINKLLWLLSQIVYANAFYPGLLTASVHFPVEITFADRKHPAIRLYTIKLLEVILDLVTEEFRHLNHPVTFSVFWDL